MFRACESVPSFGPHRSLPPQFWATDIPARKNVNKKADPSAKGGRVRHSQIFAVTRKNEFVQAGTKRVKTIR
jgi:hypothetical protein